VPHGIDRTMGRETYRVCGGGTPGLPAVLVDAGDLGVDRNLVDDLELHPGLLPRVVDYAA
jgi:hypothetical protein